MVSRLSLIKQLFPTLRSKIIGGGLTAFALYDVGCNQFGWPKIPALWGMTGALLPIWAWLFVLQCIFLYGLFEYVRGMEPQPVAGMTGAEPELTLKEQAMLALQDARNEITIALDLRTDEEHESAYHKVEAAMLSISQQFGVKLLAFKPDELGEVDYTRALRIYASYIDCFFPMLLQRHVDAAKAKATDFRRREGLNV